MRKRVLIIIVVLFLIGISVGLALSYKQWGYGIFPGYINVIAYTQDPTPEGYPAQKSVTVQIMCDGKPIGNSSAQLQVTSGQHSISFGTYSNDYETSAVQSIIVRPFETTYVYASYVPSYSYLVVDAKLYDEYSKNSSRLNATIFVDGDISGEGYVCIRLNSSELSNHTISFSEMPGCTKPGQQSISISGGVTRKVTGTYQKILTPEQETYVFCRNRIGGDDTTELNRTSIIDADQFKRWIRDERIVVPHCYVVKTGYRSQGDWISGATINYVVARYAGIYEDDQVTAAVDIYNRLNSCGIDLRSRGRLTKENYKDDSECIIVAKLEFEVNYVNVEGEIYKFKDDEIDVLPNVSGKIDLSGIGIFFAETQQVYVASGLTTLPFQERYASSFSSYTNLDVNSKGWYYTQWKQGCPYDPRELFKSLRMEAR